MLTAAAAGAAGGGCVSGVCLWLSGVARSLEPRKASIWPPQASSLKKDWPAPPRVDSSLDVDGSPKSRLADGSAGDSSYNDRFFALRLRPGEELKAA
eukprot:CAMPEP_0169289180 /NCGR_PEP_ID=MMETSP1016-20121227/60984_1 /TAXON_ID=342587 /ORGANISM="Karlodinium micrum, Strain CCMP2283" /LENGTH=96 /DNA_ID=CAMNT_0009379517 /DNA_START=1 /DNA_END=287 /DNA_ORIENTATION=+